MPLHRRSRPSCFCCRVSSIAPAAKPPQRRAASSKPATANRPTTAIAVNVWQHARLSSRCGPVPRCCPGHAQRSLRPFRLARPLLTDASEETGNDIRARCRTQGQEIMASADIDVFIQ